MDYIYDQQSALASRAAFLSVLKMLRQQHGIIHVNVIAHSMGNFLVLDALSTQAGSENPIRLSELIMAAPDVDRDNFVLAIPQVRSLVNGMTLYASSTDKALIISQKLAGRPRAGGVPLEGPVVLPGLDTVDVTAVGGDVLGLDHDIFASNRSVMNDLGALLAAPPRLAPHLRLREIRRVPDFAQFPRYWRYVP